MAVPSLPPLQKAKKGKGAPVADTGDAKTNALNALGLTLGSKNLKTLRREEVDEAFSRQFMESVHAPDCDIPNLARLGSRRQYQRIIHESYQEKRIMSDSLNNAVIEHEVAAEAAAIKKKALEAKKEAAAAAAATNKKRKKTR